MSTDANKRLVQRFVDEIFVKGRPEAIDELVAPDFVSETFAIAADGPTKLKAAAQRVHASLTDVRFEIGDVVAEDDRVAVRLTASATATGDFMGIPAAGKGYRIGEMHFFRIRDGKVVEHWHQYDGAGMMKQLGAAPG
ncbi:MAG: ester cyclase [Candidatus Limnocylindrales bacterium]